MTQQPVHDDEAPGDPGDPGAGVRTGEERVDSVVVAIEQLRERPVEEHVAAFEQAHDELRRALDDVPPDDPA